MRAAVQSIVTLAAAAALSGCATAAIGAAAGVGVFAAQERTIGEGIDDAAASAELKARLMRMDSGAFRTVDVEVAQGRALLSGAVPTVQHRLEAEKAAWSVRQVRDVANALEVGPTAGAWRSLADETLTAHVRARLMAARDVRSLDVNVETHKGVVYLMGLVRSEAELRRAAEVASYVRGVQQVVSYMSVREPRRGPKPVDDSVENASASTSWPVAQSTSEVER